MSQDYYKVLGVDKSASQDEIKKAYRKLAHQYHPDKQGGDEAKFKEVNAAYQVLGDEQKRKQYDQFGSNFEHMGGFGNAAGFDWGNFQGAYGNVDFGDLGDIFGDFFGGFRSGGGARAARGQDIQVDLTISFREAAFGARKDLELYKNAPCDHCSGTGGESGAAVKTCETCKGAGYETVVKRTMLGAVQTRSVCSHCQGKGQVYEKSCGTCGGNGIRKKKETVIVEVPAGIDDGMTLKLVGKGEAAPHQGASGDLYVRLRVHAHPTLTREGEHIRSFEYIPYTLATLGGSLDVETIDGSVTVKIPAGTESGHTFVLKGKGATRFQRSGRGDHLLTVRVDVPSKLSRAQKKVLEALRDEGL